jgi:hypothetical protein
VETEPEAAYYQSVEEFFVSRRGDPLFLSNADWDLVRRWRLAGIPLRVVLRGIGDALDGHRLSWGRDRKVASLRYCAAEVEVAHERWRRALTLGREPGLELNGALLGLANALERARDLGPEAARVAAEAAQRLRAAPASFGEDLDRWLAETEAALLKALRRQLGPERVATIETEALAGLARYQGRMPAKILTQLRQDGVARRVLGACGLPRLSLFHLEASAGELA